MGAAVEIKPSSNDRDASGTGSNGSGADGVGGGVAIGASSESAIKMFRLKVLKSKYSIILLPTFDVLISIYPIDRWRDAKPKYRRTPSSLPFLARRTN